MRRAPPLLLAAWLLAVLASGFVVWNDAHFVVARTDDDGMRTAFEFRFFEVTLHLPIWGDLEITYADLDARARREVENITIRQDIARLSRAGLLLLLLACLAPLLPLASLVFRRSGRLLRHLLFVVAGLAPLVALEHFGTVAEATMGVAVDATAASWCGRVAWGGLAVAAVVSWWFDWRRSRPVAVDPATFD